MNSYKATDEEFAEKAAELFRDELVTEKPHALRGDKKEVP